MVMDGASEVPIGGKDLVSINDEGSPLLPHHEGQNQRTGNMWSSSVNLACATIGTGILALPFALKNIGILPGIFVFLVVGFETFFTNALLVRCAFKVGKNSYQEAALRSCGLWVSNIVAIITLLGQFGSMVGAFVVIGGVVPPVINSITSNSFFTRTNILLLSLCIVLPLTIPRKINSMRFTSFLAVLSHAYMVFLVVFKSIQYLIDTPHAPLPPLTHQASALTVIQSIPIIAFAFGCTTQVVPVFYELKDRRPVAMDRVLSLEVVLAGLVYIAVSIMGYIQFGMDTASNIFTNYPNDLDVWVTIGRLLIALAVCLGFPVVFWPCRNTLEQIYLYARYGEIPEEEISTPFWLNVVEASVLVTVSLVLAIFIPDINVVFGFVGSTTMIIGIIIPCAMYLRMFPTKRLSPLYITIILSLLIGVFITVTGVASSIIVQVQAHS